MTDAEFRAEFRRVSRMATDETVTTATALDAIEAFEKLKYAPDQLASAALALRRSMDWRHEAHVDEHGAHPAR